MRFISLLLIPLALVALAGTAAAQNFPAADYEALLCGDDPATDLRADEPDALGPRDVVGDNARPVAFRAVDDDFLYLRMRLDASPAEINDQTDLQLFAWGAAFDLDNNDDDYELLIAVGGSNDQVVIRRNTQVTIPNSPRDPADDPPAFTYPFDTNGRVVVADSQNGGDADAFLELAVPWTDLDDVGIEPDTVLSLWLGSSTLPDRLDGDLACHDARGGAADPPLRGGGSRREPLDPDGDGNGSGSGNGDGPRLEGGGGCATAPVSSSVWLLALALAAWLGVRRLRAAR